MMASLFPPADGAENAVNAVKRRIESNRRALEEFTAAYPKKSEKK